MIRVRFFMFGVHFVLPFGWRFSRLEKGNAPAWQWFRKRRAGKSLTLARKLAKDDPKTSERI